MQAPKEKGVHFSVETKPPQEQKPVPVPMPGVADLPGLAYRKPDLICSSSDVGRMGFSTLLGKASQFLVPMFQRRYCWNTRTWAKMLIDLIHMKTGTHSFGRILVYHSNNSATARAEARKTDQSWTTLTVVDGQQRFTSVMLLLASCRDRAEVLLEEGTCNEEEKASLRALVQHVQRIIFRDMNAFEAWKQANPISISSSATQGCSVNRPFSSLTACGTVDERVQMSRDLSKECTMLRLVPTHFDRPCFLSAVLPSKHISSSRWAKYASSGSQLMQCKQFFDKVLGNREEGIEEGNMDMEVLTALARQLRVPSCGANAAYLKNLVQRTLGRLTMLYFNMRETEVQTVFERMVPYCLPFPAIFRGFSSSFCYYSQAIKDGFFKGLMANASPGVCMTGQCRRSFC